MKKDYQLKKWVEKREKELSKNDEFRLEYFWVIVLRVATNFGNISKDNNESKDLPNMEYLKSDVVVFEIACYLLYKIDFWLFMNKPELQKSISFGIQKYNAELFSSIFDMKLKEIGNIINERLDLFGRLVKEKREKNHIENYLFYLEQLILEAKKNDKPKSHGEFENWEFLNLNFLENTFIRIQVSNFEKYIVPSVFKSLNNLCAMIHDFLKQNPKK